MADSTVEMILKLKDEMSSKLQAIEGDLAELSAGSKKAAASVNSLEDGADRVGKGAVKLRGILSTLSPELGMMAGFADDAADAVEGLTGLMGASATTLGVLGVAVAAGYVAWRAYSEDLDRSRRIAVAAKTAHAGLIPVLDAQTTALIALKVASKEYTELEGALEEAQHKADIATREATKAETEHVFALEAEQLGIGAMVGDLADTPTGINLVAGAVGFLADAFTASSAEIQQEIDAEIGSIVEITAQQQGLLETETKIIELKAKDTAATLTQTAAIKKKTVAQEAWVVALEKERAAEREAALGASAQAGLDYLKERVRLRDQENAMIEEANRLEIGAWVAQSEENKAAAESAAAPSGVTAVDAISDPLAAIGTAAGPIGGAIVAGIVAASNLDATLASLKDVAAGLVGNLTRDFGTSVAEFAADIITDVVPGLAKAAPEIVLGLIDGIPDLVRALAGAIPELAEAFIINWITGMPRIAIALLSALLDPGLWIDVGKAIGDGMVDAVKEIFDSIISLPKGTEENPSIFEGAWWEQAGADLGISGDGNASGATYVDRTGLRMVHAGETIRRASEGVAASGGGLATGRGRMYGSGGRAVIEIDLDSLYDTMQSASRRGYSTEG